MQPRYRSFFWPAVLILAGIVALLVNLGALPVERLILLVSLWPLILIVIGLEIIVRRGFHGTAADVAAALVVILAVAGAAAYVAINPSPAASNTSRCWEIAWRVGVRSWLVASRPQISNSVWSSRSRKPD